MSAPTSNPTLGQQLTLSATSPSASGRSVARTFGVRRAPPPISTSALGASTPHHHTTLRRAASTAPDIDQRPRLLDTARPDAARAVEFEAAAHEAHAVREQCRGEGIAPEAVQLPPVEREGQRMRAIDPRSSGF